MKRDITQWLDELGLAKYAPRFVENEIDVDVLRDLSEDDLASLGLPLGPRKKLIRAIASLDAAPRPGQARAAADPRIDGERRQLTVMFCDLVDSTALSSRLDAEDLREVIRDYHAAAARAVQAYAGHVAKYLGDGVLVYFGYPQAHENDAERAVRAGLAVVDAVRGIIAAGQDGQGSPLQVRVGIDTGVVVVGDMVAEGTTEHASVVGETPNVAARLQALAAPNQIVVGELTHGLARASFAFRDLGEHALKGLPVSLRVWHVLGERETADVAPARVGAASLVGRREELGLLVRAWQASRTGRGHVVLIQGEAGIGKSRLVEALQSAVAADDPTWIVTRCSPYHTNSAFHPVIEHLKRVMRWTADDTAAVRRAKLEAALREQSLPLERAVPLYAALMSLAPGDDALPGPRLSAEEQRTQTLDALAGWLFDEAQRKPVVRVWEDLQWADSSTLELLRICVEQAPTAAVLNVVTYRPDFVPPWPMRSHITPITLNRLDRAEVEGLITALAGGKAMPAEVAAYIGEKTDGVPLYVEELTKEVLDARFVHEQQDRYALARPLSELPIPATLQDLLMARLDRLPTIREVAQLASILGREFAYEMLQAIASIEERRLEDGLDRLVDADLLYQRGRRPQARYTFKHALVQDAAYQSLLRRTRRYYHRQVGDLLEARYPDIARTQPELVAHHYVRAEEPAKAIVYLARCADNAVALHAHAEAIASLEQARWCAERLPAPERDRQMLELVVREAQSLHLSGRRREIVDLIAAQEDRAGAATPALAAELDFWLGFAQGWLGHRAEAAEYLRRALERATAAGARAIIGRVHRALATESVYSGQPLDSAVEHAREAVALLRGEDDVFWLCQALFTQSYCCIFAGRFDAALRAADELAGFGGSSGPSRAQANAAMLTGLVKAIRGEAQAAVECCERALTRSPDRFETAFVLACTGRAQLAAGNTARAVAVLQEAVEIADEVRSLQFRAWFRTLLGEACVANGETERARFAAQAARTTSGEAGFELGVGLSRRVLGMIAAEQGDSSTALNELHGAVESLASVGARFELARARMELGRIAAAGRNADTAQGELREARALFVDLELPRYVERVDALMELVGAA
ncbi:MAG TPA: adenylate/guanylate cyclase domain-containing protein [Casimicrobiaceae bacterium]